MDESLDKLAVSVSLFNKLRHVGKGGSGTRAKLRQLLKRKRLGRRPEGPGLKVPKAFAAGVNHKDKEKVLRGYRSQAIRRGNDSLVAMLPTALAEKALGKRKVHKALWKHVSEPALRADTAVGNVLAKTPGIGRAFKVKEQIPWGKGLHKEIERSSALGPLSKLRDVSEPILIGVGLERAINKATGIAKANRGDVMREDRDLREKVASAMLQLNDECKEHKKRAHALRLLYKQAELSQGVLPQTYSELEEKLASLVTQDLVVVEKALELAGGTMKLGELSHQDFRTLNATEQFQAAILGDDI